MDMLLKIRETPWGHLGTRFESQPKSVYDIVPKTEYTWQVSYLPMKTDIHDSIKNYNAVFREDTKEVLGVVNSYRPALVQNLDMFRMLYGLYSDNRLTFETISQLNYGAQIFAVFKFNESYKIFDDTIEHYFTIVNDHSKSDGKLSIIHTPVRVICQNMLSGQLPKYWQRVRIPVPQDNYQISEITDDFVDMFGNIQNRLEIRFNALRNFKIDESHLTELMDIIFPFMKDSAGQILDMKANEVVESRREQFVSECIHADDLANVEGTALQLYQAVIDFDQHMYKQLDKSYDIGYRIKKLPSLQVEKGISDVGIPYINSLVA